MATLTTFYRYFAGEGSKPRPGFYSKQLALESFCQALSECYFDVMPVFLIDGDAPQKARRTMAANGHVAEIDGGSVRRSYRTMLEMAVQFTAGDGMVWFAEDDYFYRGDSLTALMDGVRQVNKDSYLSLYSPQDIAGLPEWRVWPPARSTTASFGAHATTLREDLWLLRQAPFTGGAWDDTMFCLLAHRWPYSRSQGATMARSARGLARLAVTAQLLAEAKVRGPARRLFASNPVLAWHMEEAPDNPMPSWLDREMKRQAMPW